MIERTEERGLAARLPIVVGGSVVELRTLNLDESDKWLAKFNKLEVEADMPTQAMLELALAYDVEKVLGPSASLRKRITKVELHNALNQMIRAEAPFQEAARSVVAASGVIAPPDSLMYHLIVRSLQASTTSSPLPIGELTPPDSEETSPRNGSSSSGPTLNAGSNGRHRSKASSPKSPQPTATPT